MAKGMVPVELVDDGEPGGDDLGRDGPGGEGAGGDGGRPAASARTVAARVASIVGRVAATAGRAVSAGWRRRTVRVVAAGTVLALAGGLVVHTVTERRRLEALAGIPGVIRPVGSDLGPAFVVEADSWPVVTSGFAFGDLVVGAKIQAQGGSTIVALDAADGTARWTTDLADADRGGAWEVGYPSCAPAGTLLACTAGPLGPAGPGAAWVLDPADGRVVRTVRLPEHAWAQIAGGLLVVAEQSDGPRRAPAEGPWRVRWTVSGQDPATGTAIWGWRSPEVLVHPTTLEQNLAHDPDDYASDLSALGGVSRHPGSGVTLSVGEHTWVIGTGGELQVDLDDGPWFLGAPRDGVLRRLHPDDDSGLSRSPAPELLAADGTWFPCEGDSLWLTVDDGSAPGLYFASRPYDEPPGVTAYDVVTGLPRWTWEAEGTGWLVGAVLLDGRLFVGGGIAPAALDAETGDVLWVSPQGPAGVLTTDGSVLLTFGAEAGVGSVVRAVALRDGTELWTRSPADLVGTDAHGNARGLAAVEASPGFRRLLAIRGDSATVVLR